MKRYQNPDIFEHLAMSYALGTLQGRARLRFEKLQAKHLYLRAVTDAYQQQFAPLAQMLPGEQPPARVWAAISRELKLGKQTTIQPAGWLARLQDYLPWSVAAFASVAASVMTVLLLTANSQPAAYMATMKSPEAAQMIVATVSRETMQVAFDMPANVLPAESGMTPTFWCIPKDKAMPLMRMGTLANHDGMKMPIDKKVWKELAGVGEFAISMEPMDKPPADKPMGKVVFSGELAAL
ncbi:anti-sigma factor [Thiothrix subterranea]|uniref:Anti-sigma factor n=1 Tax=Thiothrix subterranea TaxID=2735563 RepID=A0AA51MJF8_9GAMM|nr:anti-sigma factor [Thiothrix subterranea]MDQ5768672.1 anti-sigma factor [Thiothrix subterranea]WML84824.1 anti-sigma factor [Thiothrix subterranea]